MTAVIGPNEVVSPCIGVCELNDDEICLGCGRSLDDIAQWSAADDDQRLQILEQAQHRRETFNQQMESTETL